MNKKVIKKNILGLSGYLMLEALFLKGISHIDFDKLEFIDMFNILGAIIVFILIIKSLLYPYVIIENGYVRIFRDYFYKENFKVDDIVTLHLSDSFFSKSNFQLKNNKKIKFDSFSISKENLDFLKNISRH